MGKKWIFIYSCPYFLKDPENHRHHVRWVAINNEEEAEHLAKSYGLPWPASSAMAGTLSFTQIDDDIDEGDFVERYLRGSVGNYRWFKEHYGPTV